MPEGGYCNACKLPSKSLHKCGKCGKYVARPMGSARELSDELRAGKRDIRLKYEDDILKVEQSLNHLAAGQVNERKRLDEKRRELERQIKKEIRAYLDPGLPK